MCTMTSQAHPVASKIDVRTLVTREPSAGLRTSTIRLGCIRRVSTGNWFQFHHKTFLHFLAMVRRALLLLYSGPKDPNIISLNNLSQSS